MVYLIDAVDVHFKLLLNYDILIGIIDKDILDLFISNFSIGSGINKSLNIEFVNMFRNKYKNEFISIMNIIQQRAI